MTTPSPRSGKRATQSTRHVAGLRRVTLTPDACKKQEQCLRSSSGSQKSIWLFFRAEGSRTGRHIGTAHLSIRTRRTSITSLMRCAKRDCRSDCDDRLGAALDELEKWLTPLGLAALAPTL